MAQLAQPRTAPLSTMLPDASILPRYVVLPGTQALRLPGSLAAGAGSLLLQGRRSFATIQVANIQVTLGRWLSMPEAIAVASWHHILKLSAQQHTLTIAGLQQLHPHTRPLTAAAAAVRCPQTPTRCTASSPCAFLDLHSGPASRSTKATGPDVALVRISLQWAPRARRRRCS